MIVNKRPDFGFIPTAFYALFLGPSLTYSAAYFEREDMSLEQAQLAKIDAILHKCQLQPGMKLLDVGCGWGSTLKRAAEQYQIDVVGITPDHSYYQYARDHIAQTCAQPQRVRVLLQGWQDFTEPVDRIVCINAFENFNPQQRERFFGHCRDLLPSDGRLIVLAVTASKPVFRVLSTERMLDLAQAAGFAVETTHSLAPHYIRTLDLFAANLQAARDRAIELTAPETFDFFIQYYTKSAAFLRRGLNDLVEFTFRVD